jgi:hypothetical protein
MGALCFVPLPEKKQILRSAQDDNSDIFWAYF